MKTETHGNQIGSAADSTSEHGLERAGALSAEDKTSKLEPRITVDEARRAVLEAAHPETYGPTFRKRLDQLIAAVSVQAQRQIDDLKAQIAFDESQRNSLLVQAYENGKRDALQWQPISSAPKDGTPVLAFDIGGCFIAEYRASVRSWVDGQARCWAPTHYMPLPPAPTTGEN